MHRRIDIQPEWSPQVLLDEAARVLLEPHGAAELAAALADFLAQRLADVCVVDLLDGKGRVEHVAVGHRDPSWAPLFADRIDGAPLAATSFFPMEPKAGEEARLIVDLTADVVRRAGGGVEEARLVEGLDLRTAMVLSLASRGRVTGAMLLLRREPAFQEAVLNLVREVARHASLALENARLVDALREAEARQHVHEERALDLVIRLSAERRVVSISPACRIILGTQPEAYVGLPLGEHLHREDAPGVGAAFDAIRAGGGARRVVFRMRRAHVGYAWMEAVVQPAPATDPSEAGVVLVHARDVTIRRRGEQRSREVARATTLQRVTAALASASRVTDVADAIVRHVVPAMGASAGGIVLVEGAEVRVVRAVGYPESVLARWRSFPMASMMPLTDAIRRGAPVFIRDTEETMRLYPALVAEPAVAMYGASAALPFRVNGRTAGAIGLSFAEPRRVSPGDERFLLTLSHLCGQSMERAQLHEAQLEARRALTQSEKMAALGSLVSGLAHEVRTPLTAIQNHVTLTARVLHRAAQDPDPEEVRALASEAAVILGRLEDSVDRIVALVTQLRRFSRLQPGTRAPAALQDVVAEAVDLFVAAHRGGASIEADLKATPACVVDRLQVQQVVLNLLQNAVDASRGRRSPVRVRTWGDDLAAYLEVSDEGPGIPAAVRARMFEPLVSTKTDGMGLGLSIVKRIVDDHDAMIRFETAPQEGTKFCVTFPVSHPPPQG